MAIPVAAAGKKTMEAKKRIGLVAHDAKKDRLIDWVRSNAGALRPHRFWSTGTTGEKIGEAVEGLDITVLKSGPLGGDQQIGAMIAENRLDLLIFFMDPLSAQPHEADVQAVVRLATLYNVVLATNTAAADFIVSSPLFAQAYEPADGAPD
jgi:methylglyoxal synthase